MTCLNYTVLLRSVFDLILFDFSFMLYRADSKPFVVGTYHMPCMFKVPSVMMIHCALSAQHIHKYANNDPYVLVGDFNIRPGASLSHPVHPFFLSFFLIFIVTYLVQLLFVWLPLFRFLTLPCLALPHHATRCSLMPLHVPNSTALLNLLIL